MMMFECDCGWEQSPGDVIETSKDRTVGYCPDCNQSLRIKKDPVANFQCSDGLVALTDLAHELGLLVKSARSKERAGQIEAEAHELAEARVLIKIEKIKREAGN